MSIRPQIDKFPGPDILEVVWQELNKDKYFIGVKVKYKDSMEPTEMVALVGREELNYYQSKYPNKEINGRTKEDIK